MTSFIVEYVSEPVTRSFEGARTHRPWLQGESRGEGDRAESGRKRRRTHRQRTAEEAVDAESGGVASPAGD